MNKKRFSKALFKSCFWLMFVPLSVIQVNAQVDNSLIGEWTGIVNQPGFASFKTEMTIESLIVDVASGGTEYPDLPCSALNIFKGNEDSLHVFSETITNGSICIDGRVEIYLLSNDTIQFNWYCIGGTVIAASGQLVRQETTSLNNEAKYLKPFQLSGISPNPFNNYTEFTLELNNSEDVIISLIDLNGREVISIYKGRLLPFQKHLYAINRKNLPSGLYVLIVKSASFKIVKKVFIID